MRDRLISLLAIAAVVLGLGGNTAHAQTGALVRVIDVGAGLCTVTRVPGPSGSHYMVVDAGSQFPFNTEECVSGVSNVVGDSEIDLLIISHSDADHVYHAQEILETFTVKRVVRTGYERTNDFWKVRRARSPPSSILAVLGPEGSPTNAETPLPHCGFPLPEPEDPAPWKTAFCGALSGP